MWVRNFIMSVIRTIPAHLAARFRPPVDEVATVPEPTIARPHYDNLATLLKTSVRDFAENPLFGTQGADTSWNWTTYREFGALVANARSGLAQRGVMPGDRVGIISNNRVEWAAAAYAAYTRGAAVVPMYESQRPDEWAHILSDSGTTLVFAGNDTIRDQLHGLHAQLPDLKSVISFDGEGAETFQGMVEEGAKKAVPARTPKSDSLASIIYTSGTTGLPKGVASSHRSLTANVNSVLKVVPLDSHQRSLAVLPWNHVAGQIGELHSLIASGGSTAIYQGRPGGIPKAAGAIEPSIFFGVPKLWSTVYAGAQDKIEAPLPPMQKLMDLAAAAHAKQDGGESLRLRERAAIKVADSKTFERVGTAYTGKIKKVVTQAVNAAEKRANGEHLTLGDKAASKVANKVIFPKVRAALGGNVEIGASGAAALDPYVAKFMYAAGVPITEGYGSTEGGFITLQKVGEFPRGVLGDAMPGITLKVDTSVPNGDAATGRGELLAHGDQVNTTYWNNREATAAAHTKDGWFRTGDSVQKVGDEYLFLGRSKGGFKLDNGNFVGNPEQIDATLSESPWVANAVIYGEGKTSVTALVVPDEARAKTWAAQNGMTGKSLAEIIQNPAFKAKIMSEINAISEARIDTKYERPRDVVLSAEPLTPENDLMTSSFKVKRAKVHERYKDALEQLPVNQTRR